MYLEPNTKFTDFEVIQKAHSDANDFFIGTSWTVIGGPSTIFGASILGNIGGELFDGMGALGGLIGGIYFLPQILSNTTVSTPFIDNKFSLDNYSNKQKNYILLNLKKKLSSLENPQCIRDKD